MSWREGREAPVSCAALMMLCRVFRLHTTQLCSWSGCSVSCLRTRRAWRGLGLWLISVCGGCSTAELFWSGMQYGCSRRNCDVHIQEFSAAHFLWGDAGCVLFESWPQSPLSSPCLEWDCSPVSRCYLCRLIHCYCWWDRHWCVIYKPVEIGAVFWCAVMSLQGEEQGAEHTYLGGPHDQYDGAGFAADLNCLWSSGPEVQ